MNQANGHRSKGQDMKEERAGTHTGDGQKQGTADEAGGGWHSGSGEGADVEKLGKIQYHQPWKGEPTTQGKD